MCHGKQIELVVEPAPAQMGCKCPCGEIDNIVR